MYLQPGMKLVENLKYVTALTTLCKNMMYISEDEIITPKQT